MVDWYAPWCGPCQLIAPAYDEMSIRYPDVLFLKINGDQHKVAAMQNMVSSYPTFQFIDGGKEIHRFSGADVRLLEAKISGFLNSREEDRIANAIQVIAKVVYFA